MRANVRYWLLPGLSPVEMLAADYFNQRFSAHWHLGYAVGVVTRGAQRFRADGLAWSAGPGDVVTLNPGQVHDGEALTPGGWSVRMAYFPGPALAALLGVGEPGAFGCPVARQPALASAFLDWHDAMETEHDPVRALAATRAFAALLRPSLLPGTKAGAAEAALQAERQRLVGLADVGAAAVSALAEPRALSRFTVWRQCKSGLGIAPKPLMTHLRLIAVKRLLVEGHPVADAALACGFHDQSHLTRQFASAYGITPAQFRRVAGGAAVPAGPG
ncbi:AraC family transcriptional regulator [Aquincola sp. MAHUQ-54]|uniref:AraC family transcriptional regulator n=1 Tax=Aquincola agrisoli TaxID=3119538 RepID=A0AAW9QPM6_9BURK